MHKRIYLLLALSCAVVSFLAGGILFSTPGSLAPVTGSQPVGIAGRRDIGAAPTVAFTSDAPSEIAPLAKKELPITNPMAQPPLHDSDILRRVPFQQNEYFAALTPNDSNYPLWHLSSVGAPSAWDTTTGSSSVSIAVIDTGFALAHQEFANRWHINPTEQGTTSPGSRCWTGTSTNKQTNLCDDDQNGYIDDWRGWDFSGQDNSPQAGSTNPTGIGINHGSLVAGLTAAQGNNSLGLPGLDWGARIMPLQALSDNGSGYTSDVVAAVEYAVDNGADIINLSLSGPSYDYSLYLAISYARAQNVLVVTSSGNCATLLYSYCHSLKPPGYMGYPALFEDVVAVGALTESGQRASFSSYGKQLDIIAPGQLVDISTGWSQGNPTSHYISDISGTSFSAPIVSGIAGLIWAADPSLTSRQVQEILLRTAVQPNIAHNTYEIEYGFGNVRADLAIAAATSNRSSDLERSQSDQPLSASSDGQNPANPLGINELITTTITSYPGDEISLIAKRPNGAPVNLGTAKVGSSGQATLSWQTATLSSGIWHLSARGRLQQSATEILYIGS